MEKSFYINHAFLIEPDANAVTNRSTGLKTHLEARLMQLLLMLVEKQGSTVTRDELVTAIWKDYGGGDEGLTQAISILRKAFSDDAKTLIQTVHKKGYILNAVITHSTGNAQAVEKHKKPVLNARKKLIAASFAALLTGCICIFYFLSYPGKTTRSFSINTPYPADLAKEDSLEENAINTIATQAPDSTFYKLVIIGDQPPKFYINSKRIAEGEWEPYMPLINSLKKKLVDRRKAMQ